jgi:aspartyl/asparaginyl-tRNA synthetase
MSSKGDIGNFVSPRILPPRSWRTPAGHLRAALTDPWFRVIATLLHRINMATQEFYSSQGLISASLPITTGAISSPMGLGSDSLPVEVELMGVRTFLADSAQFMLELMCRIAGVGAYYVMPSFRGEQTDKTHLAQFYHSEIEILGDLSDVMALSEKYLIALSSAILTHHADLVRDVAGETQHVEALLAWGRRFPSIRHGDALSELRDGAGQGWVTTLPGDIRAITRTGEAELARRLGVAGSTIWITHFDHAAVPFYQAIESGGSCALNADLLLGGRETIGAGQRHRHSREVAAALRSHEVAQAPYQWYLDMRDISPLQTSGMGMGVERFLMWLLNQSDIRDMMILLRENGVNHVP